jgi:hypothetical protein
VAVPKRKKAAKPRAKKGAGLAAASVVAAAAAAATASSAPPIDEECESEEDYEEEDEVNSEEEEDGQVEEEDGQVEDPESFERVSGLPTRRREAGAKPLAADVTHEEMVADARARVERTEARKQGNKKTKTTASQYGSACTKWFTLFCTYAVWPLEASKVFVTKEGVIADGTFKQFFK